jgi:hypothetical protein
MKPLSWSWAPVWAIGCAAIANAVMITVSLSTRPDAVTVARSSPGGADASVAARRQFELSGARLRVVGSQDGIKLALLGGGLRDVIVACERPSDARMDVRAVWRDPEKALDLELPASGCWTVRLSAVDASGQPVERIAEIMLPH